MTQEQMHVIIGRLVCEKVDAVRRAAAINAELGRVAVACKNLAEYLRDTLRSSDLPHQLRDVAKYFSIDALQALLREREETQALIAERTEQLRNLGAGE